MTKAIAIIRHPEPGEPSPAQMKSGRYKKRVVDWKGLKINIENEPGTFRRGVKPDGSTAWESLMKFAYGEIRGTEGVDGDPVDIFLGPMMDLAPTVFVIHQRRVDDWENYDEDKCMVGFMQESDAIDAFLSCYDDRRFLGPITEMPVAEFIAKVRATKDAPAMVKSQPVALLLKGYVHPYIRDGRPVSGYVNRRADGVEASGDPYAADALPGVAKIKRNLDAPKPEYVPAGGGSDEVKWERVVPPELIDELNNRPPLTPEAAAWAAQYRKLMEEVDRPPMVVLPAQGDLFAEAPAPEPSNERFYVTMVRHPGTARQKVGFLAGPFHTHDEAKAHVSRARKAAVEADPDAAFDAFGTSSRKADHHPPGVLNRTLGL